MSWVAIIGLAVVVFIGLAALLKAPRVGWEAIIAALLVGLAGYALQGRPDLPAAPHDAAEADPVPGAILVTQRQMLAGQTGVIAASGGDPMLLVADAFVRHGEYADAVDLLRGAVAKYPQDGEAWLALGNALVGHSGGMLSPAALYAYDHAAAAEPDAPGPPFFRGLALASSGQLLAARATWAALLAKAPAQAAWRSDLVFRLKRLDQLIGEARAAGLLQ